MCSLDVASDICDGEAEAARQASARVLTQMVVRGRCCGGGVEVVCARIAAIIGIRGRQELAMGADTRGRTRISPDAGNCKSAED